MLDANTTRTKQGFTKFPNHLFGCSDLSANGRLVALALLGYAREDGVCYPSQATLADDIGRDRKTVTAGVEELREFGLTTFWKCRPGFSKPVLHYDVAALREPVDEDTANCACGSHKRKRNNVPPVQSRAGGELTPSRSSRREIISEPEGNSSPLSRSREENVSATATPEVSVSKSASVPASGSGEAKPTESLGKSGSAASPAPFAAKPDKRLVNAALLGPSGLRVSGEPTDVEHEAYRVMSELWGESIPKPKLEALMEKYGVRNVHFWVKWLPRKVAAQYERDKPVENPSGLLIRAIENQWDVDPRWPEFDASAHTWKAREVLDRKEARKADHKPEADLNAEFNANFGPDANVESVAVGDDLFPF
jgi:hypothetical protein